jgi:hypothetical protein
MGGGRDKGQEREIQPRSFDSEDCEPQRAQRKKIPEGRRAQKNRACNEGVSEAFRQFVRALTFASRNSVRSNHCTRTHSAFFMKDRCNAATASFNAR